MIAPSDIPPDRPVLIAGPTASGKSALALAIAEAQGGVIVNADALQVFANWRILTARPPAACGASRYETTSFGSRSRTTAGASSARLNATSSCANAVPISGKPWNWASR